MAHDPVKREEQREVAVCLVPGIFYALWVSYFSNCGNKIPDQQQSEDERFALGDYSWRGHLSG